MRETPGESNNRLVWRGEADHQSGVPQVALGWQAYNALLQVTRTGCLPRLSGRFWVV